jgi:hypothetical protein
MRKLLGDVPSCCKGLTCLVYLGPILPMTLCSNQSWGVPGGVVSPPSLDAYVSLAVGMLTRLESHGAQSLTMLMLEGVGGTELGSTTLTSDVSGARSCTSAWHPCIPCMHAPESVCIAACAECRCHMSWMLLASGLEHQREKQVRTLNVRGSWHVGDGRSTGHASGIILGSLPLPPQRPHPSPLLCPCPCPLPFLVWPWRYPLTRLHPLEWTSGVSSWL